MALGRTLAGRALVRLSNAWWRGGKEWPDVQTSNLKPQALLDPRPAPHYLFGAVPDAAQSPPAPSTTAPAPGAVPGPGGRHQDLVGSLIVIGALLCLYLPLAGSYGLWDPWETHYSEVARTMNATGDYLSPRWQDENFWSKPAGTLWLLAAGMKLFGVGTGGPDEMVASTLPEWSLRLPVILISIFGIWALWLMVSRLVSRRAGFLTAAVLATMPQWFFITRQAMTDIPDVGLMTGGLALLLLALKDQRSEEPLRTVRVGPFQLTGAHVVLAVVTLLVLGQAAYFTFGLIRGFQKKAVPPLAAVGNMAPYVLMLAGLILASWGRLRVRRQLRLLVAYLTFAIAVWMKGLLGIAIPGMVVVGYLLVTWDFRILLKAELHLGVLLVMAVAFPWYHAMIALHGRPFWNEMFVQHHFQRLAVGVHGDKGSFEYFVNQLGTGLFPWSALMPVALARTMTSRPDAGPRGRAIVFAAVWFLGVFTLFSLSVTKFHHYILPALPAMAVLIGVFLDDLAADRVARPALALLAALGFLVVIGANLAEKPIRLIWLYVYNYTRAFPKIDFAPALWAFIGVALVPLALLLWRQGRRVVVWLTVAAAVAFTYWALDGYMVRLTPHWSQKLLIHEYFKRRHGPDERLIAWQMNWRGENFYTKGAIAGQKPEAWTVFMSLDNTQMLNYLKARPGRKFFFILEHSRLATFKRILPTDQAKQSLHIEDDQSNNKFLLASATM
jgi:4-amino-4-deoxy-L-arabinose transferase-like glycosyltransferase